MVLTLRMVWVALALAAQAGLSAAAERAPSFSYSVEPQGLRTGQELRLRLSFSWVGEAGEFRFLIPPLALENLTLRDSSESNETSLLAAGTRITRTFDYKLAAGAKGPARVGSLALAALDPAGEKHPFDFPEQSFIIKGKPFPWAPFACWVGAISLSAGILWTGVRLARKRVRLPSSPAVSSEQAALKALNELAGKLSGFQPQEAMTELQHILSAYERQAAARLDDRERKQLAGMHEELTALTYAGVAVAPSRLRALEQNVRQFISAKQIVAPQP